jgi:hypothetical protein
VAQQWRQRTGGGFALACRFLRSSGKLAATYPHPDPGICFYRVVTHGADDHVAVCDETGERRQLRTDEILIYELDRLALARGLAHAFCFEPEDGYDLSRPPPWRIGRIAPMAGYVFPVYLAIPSWQRNLLVQLTDVLEFERGPFLVLAPTGRYLCAVCRQLLRERRACFLALSDAVLAEEEGLLVISPTGTEQVEQFLGQVVPQVGASAPAPLFATPAGARWSDVRLRFVDGHTLAVRVGNAAGRFNFSQMGMANRKNSTPTVQWELLREFAAGYGSLTWNSPAADRKNKKRRENLARDLVAFFRIEGEPFVRDGGGWRTVFSIEPDS